MKKGLLIYILLFVFYNANSQTIKVECSKRISNSNQVFILKNIKYPTIDIEQKIEGREIVAVKINKDGVINDTKIIKSLSSSIDKETIRVLKKLTQLQPLKYKGKPISTWIYFTINFSIEN